jgi:probable rRNA maturation factor
VLSFPAGEYDPETGSRYLGDILISTAYAARQAAQYGHSPEAETQLLVIHGVLHLLGYDHAEPEEKERMWAEQTAILQLLGLGSLPVREE